MCCSACCLFIQSLLLFHKNGIYVMWTTMITLLHYIYAVFKVYPCCSMYQYSFLIILNNILFFLVWCCCPNYQQYKCKLTIIKFYRSSIWCWSQWTKIKVLLGTRSSWKVWKRICILTFISIKEIPALFGQWPLPSVKPTKQGHVFLTILFCLVI